MRGICSEAGAKNTRKHAIGAGVGQNEARRWLVAAMLGMLVAALANPFGFFVPCRCGALAQLHQRAIAVMHGPPPKRLKRGENAAPYSYIC